MSVGCKFEPQRLHEFPRRGPGSPHVLSAAASVYDEIRRAECLIGPAQIDRCVLLMSAPNEPYARVNASRGWSLPVIRPEPRLASCAGVTPATGPHDPLWAHLSDHANEVFVQLMAVVEQALLAKTGKIDLAHAQQLGRLLLLARSRPVVSHRRSALSRGRHNRYADGISSSAAGRRRTAPSPAASPARSARASGSPRSRRVARPAPNWAKKPWRALPDRHAGQIPRLAASDPRDPRHGLRDVRPSCT